MTINDSEYAQILQQAVLEIQTARTTVARLVNTTVNSVYWNIGKLLFDRNLESGYGSGMVKRLSVNVKEQLPDMGLYPRNLWGMKRFYERYKTCDSKLRQLVAVLPILQADYANEVFKSSYNLGFLGITEPLKELELEKRLVSKIRSFILELGKGFSFIGNQYRLEYNSNE